MAKLAFLAAVLAALVALSVAEEYNTLQLQCQRELQESSLDACQQIVNHQLAIQLPFFLPQSSQLRTGVQVQCCQQLQDISRKCRIAAIRQIVRPYEHQALVPLRDDPYNPGEDEEEQEEGSYYPVQQHGQGLYQPSQTYRPQQHQQESYRPSQTSQEQQEQEWYRPSQTYRPQQHQQESYSPSQTSQEQQEQGWYRPSQTYRPQQHQQESYRPSQTSQEQQEQGWYRPSQTYQQGSYRPSQTYQPQQHQQGSYRPSQTFLQQQQEEGGLYGQSTAHQQQQQQQHGRQEPYRLRITIYRPARQTTQHELDQTMRQEGQGQYCGRQSQQTGFGRFSSPPRFGTEQQVARLRVVAKARQVAAQLPAMCRLQSSAFSTSEY